MPGCRSTAQRVRAEIPERLPESVLARAGAREVNHDRKSSVSKSRLAECHFEQIDNCFFRDSVLKTPLSRNEEKIPPSKLILDSTDMRIRIWHRLARTSIPVLHLRVSASSVDRMIIRR